VFRPERVSLSSKLGIGITAKPQQFRPERISQSSRLVQT